MSSKRLSWHAPKILTGVIHNAVYFGVWDLVYGGLGACCHFTLAIPCIAMLLLFYTPFAIFHFPWAAVLSVSHYLLCKPIFYTHS